MILLSMILLLFIHFSAPATITRRATAGFILNVLSLKPSTFPRENGKIFLVIFPAKHSAKLSDTLRVRFDSN